MIRVALVDDQALVRIGFRMVLEAETDIEVVGEAADGHAAIAMLERIRADVVLMDVRMPGLDGIAATRAILDSPQAPRVIVLTTFDLDEYAFEALRAGASGFLLKDARPEQLLQAIRAVHAGEAALAPRVTRRLIELVGAELPVAGSGAAVSAGPAAGALGSLTPREQEVLTAIAAGRSNTEIASELFLSESTVKTHVGRVFSKLGLRDRVHAVIFAYENGLAPGAG
ncbi:LuxR family two component transcriptional regulator [Microterricola gilva]|uniref:LuxR family two component transcriptional regulator n=2 Tax=Microterricola gilva TaxID=393267 RepID=A0A4Q8ALV1_9MICO|nr:LuxR family two component transcriptional regulator [Microterricola gilva]